MWVLCLQSSTCDELVKDDNAAVVMLSTRYRAPPPSAPSSAEMFTPTAALARSPGAEPEATGSLPLTLAAGNSRYTLVRLENDGEFITGHRRK